MAETLSNKDQISHATPRLQDISQQLSPIQDLPYERLIRFLSKEGIVRFARLDAGQQSVPPVGTVLESFASIDDLMTLATSRPAELLKLLAPAPSPHLPIYCVGINYRAHAEEAKLVVPSTPTLWNKPAAALANPGDDIPINKFCASNLPDYEGEFAFVTSRTCRDITPEEAGRFILGYTIGNDLSCRSFQKPDIGGGQYFFAKGFDNFAPLGPVLVNPQIFHQQQSSSLKTRLNGDLKQEADCFKEFIWSPEQVLSHMSQGTTIPAGTVVLTGTPSGVGIFQKPPRLLKHHDVVTIEVDGIGILSNRIVFV